MKKCGCENGDFCTKTTLCHVEAAVEDHKNKIELLEPVVEAAVEFHRQVFNGLFLDAAGAKKAFFEAVVEYERQQ